MAAALSMGEGRRAGLAATLGVAVGLFVNALAAALGVAYIVSASPWVWDVLRWGGAAFLLWLAWESWRDAGETSPALAASGRGRHHFGAGLLVNLLNPKAMLFYVVVIPRFNHGALPGFALALAMAALSILIATAVHLGIVFAGSRVGGWLIDPARTRTIRRILALMILAVAIWFAITAGR